MEKLFDQLKIGEYEVEEKKSEQLSRIIIVNDIQAINSVAFNIFIARILEYNRIPFPKYNYILIFDIAYDPKNLYDKFNVSFLPKLQFLTINNTPSHHLYHEILYNFIYSRNSSFYIPKSQSIKVILESIDLHQISIDAFKHYFRFILFQFFFMHHWNDDEYLLFMEELNEHKIKKEIKQEENENKDQVKDKKSQKKKSIEIENMDDLIDNKRREILEQKLKEIYMSSNELKELTKKYKVLPSNINIEVEKLLNNYKEKMNNWKIVKLFYQLFEGFIPKYLMKEKNDEEKIYNFLYKFLQYDEQTDQDKILSNRVSEIHEIITKIDKPTEAIKDYFYPKFKEIVEKIEPLLNKEDNVHDSLISLVKDKFGNYVVQKMIEYAPEKSRMLIVEHIMNNHELRKKKDVFAKHVINFIEKKGYLINFANMNVNNNNNIMPEMQMNNNNEELNNIFGNNNNNNNSPQDYQFMNDNNNNFMMEMQGNLGMFNNMNNINEIKNDLGLDHDEGQINFGHN